jgi:site-specific DNA-methyltransferase (adenine-specific)
MEAEIVISSPNPQEENHDPEIIWKDAYEDSGVVFAHLDALSFLQKQKKNSVDLILTDPPYVISRKTGFESCVNGVERFKVSMDFGSWDQENTFAIDTLSRIVKECYRVLKKGGTLIMFYDLWKIQELKAAMESHKFKQIRLIEWLKTNPVPLNSQRNYLTNAREIAVSAVKVSKPTFHSSYDNGVYQYPICHEKGRFHPTQKPLEFMKELITKHSHEGDTILDCFAGSATTLVAGKICKRNVLGCEKNEEYFSKAVQRLLEVKM